MLRLEAEAITMLVALGCFALEAAIKEVAAIKLNSGLRGMHCHHAARLRFGDSCGKPKLSSGAVHNKIVIVTFPELQVLVVCCDTFSNRIGRRKSKGVPSTFCSSPVGISPESIGVKRSAAIII